MKIEAVLTKELKAQFDDLAGPADPKAPNEPRVLPVSRVRA